jgi:hypothetical protein
MTLIDAGHGARNARHFPNVILASPAVKGNGIAWQSAKARTVRATEAADE